MTDVSREYGTALFMVACEQNAKYEFMQALDLMQAVFTETPSYIDYLSSPAISINEKKAATNEAFSGKVPVEILSYLQLLCEKGRLSSFSKSVMVYKQLLDASEHRMSAVVTSAIPLTDAEKEKLQKKLEEKYQSSLTIQYTIDASLLGGLTIEIDGKLIDGSVRSQLDEIKDVIRS